MGLAFAGCFLGAGYVSGQELWQFFGSFGIKGAAGLLLAIALLLFAGVVMILLGRITGLKEIDKLVVRRNVPVLRGAVMLLELLFLFGVGTIMSAGIGLLMGCIGMDPINGATRFTFGNVYLTSGISTVAQMLGMFAMCQIIRDSAKGEAKMPDVNIRDMKGLGIGFRDIIENIKTIFFAFASGLWIGFLPGMGSGISNMVAYGYAKSISKEPETFGKGNPAGIWASETANNASLGGALIPMMALGIPGDGITAMLIAGLTIHGLQAGPLFMTEQPDLAMLIFACVMISAIVTYLIQIVTKRWFPYILKIPYHYLYSVILVISFIGGYGISNTMFNIYVMLALCLLSLFMSVAGLPTSPLVLAFILSSKLERYFRQGISYAHGSYAPFFTRPISLILLLVSVFCVFWPYISDHLKAKKAGKAETIPAVEVNDD